MNRISKNIGARLAILVLAGLLTGAAQAQTPKIATVDLEKVFDGYYVTKQADARLRERADEAKKVLEGMMEDYKKANQEYSKLLEGANDQAVSSEERERRKKSAETKLAEINDIQKNVQQFRSNTQATLDDQKLRMRSKILSDILEVVTAKARTGQFTLVVDTAAKSINQTPIVLFSDGKNDLTDEVLKQVNASAPPGVLNAAPAPAATDKK